MSKRIYSTELKILMKSLISSKTLPQNKTIVAKVRLNICSKKMYMPILIGIC
jgi:hypothetical protein